MTGKKTSIATIIILLTGLVTPNQAFAIGANAMIGIALAAMANGMSAPRARAKREVAKATTRPPVSPMAKPPTASISVVSPAAMQQVAIRDQRGRDVRRRRQQESLDLERRARRAPRAAMPPTKTASVGR